MITEDYVSFNTAKLLKEKGFDEPCRFIYDAGYFCSIASRGCRWNEGYGDLVEEQSNSEYSGIDNRVSAPTLAMTMKWLREKHGLNVYALAVWKDVEIQYDDWEEAVVGYDWVVESLSYSNSPKTSTGKSFRTYEQACEAAIKYCLENLI